MENYISVKNTLGCQAPDFLGRGVWRLMCLTLPQVKGDTYLKMKTQRNTGQVRLYIYFFLTCRCRITSKLLWSSSSNQMQYPTVVKWPMTPKGKSHPAYSGGLHWTEVWDDAFECLPQFPGTPLGCPFHWSWRSSVCTFLEVCTIASKQSTRIQTPQERHPRPVFIPNRSLPLARSLWSRHTKTYISYSLPKI